MKKKGLLKIYHRKMTTYQVAVLAICLAGFLDQPAHVPEIQDDFNRKGLCSEKGEK